MLPSESAVCCCLTRLEKTKRSYLSLADKTTAVVQLFGTGLLLLDEGGLRLAVQPVVAREARALSRRVVALSASTAHVGLVVSRLDLDGRVVRVDALREDAY